MPAFDRQFAILALDDDQMIVKPFPVADEDIDLTGDEPGPPLRSLNRRRAIARVDRPGLGRFVDRLLGIADARASRNMR